MRTSESRVWPRRKLGDFFRLKHGYAFKGKYFSSEGKYILLTPGNFAPEGGIKLKGEKEKHYVGQFPDEFLLKRDELLVVMTDLKQDAPILGSAAFVPVDDRFLHNQRLGKVVDLRTWEIHERYLYYLFNSSGVRGQIKASATGATVRHTAPDRIYSVDVSLPDIETQRKIVPILSAYDDLIENNLRRITILEEMAQNLYREWFVKFRFPGHEKVRMVDSPMGMIPERWEVVHLVDSCDIVMGQSPKSEFYNTSGDGLPFHQGVSNFGPRFPTEHVFCTMKNRIAETGDILLSVRAPVGRINLADKRLIVGRGLCAIRNKNGQQWFTLHQLKERFQQEDTMGGGTIFKAVTRKDVESIESLNPASLTVRAFEEICYPVEVQIEILTDKNTNLRQTRDLLLPKLISGELDVSDLDIKTGGHIQ